jgi:uncharacterized protein YjcR
MGRTATHDWRSLYLEYCQGRYKSIAEFARKKNLNSNQVRDEFRRLNGSRSKLMREALSATDKQQEKKQQRSVEEKKQEKKRQGSTEKKQRLTDKPTKIWNSLKQQFAGWPQEKLDNYLIQIESRLAELSSDYDELTKEEQKEFGLLRRERRTILSNPDPDKICAGHRRGGEPCKNPVERGKNTCWMHGGAPGSGGQIGNRNPMRHGFYTKIMPDDPELKEIIEAIDAKSPIDIVWDQIVIQYAQIARAQKIMYVRDRDEMIKEIKKVKVEKEGNSKYNPEISGSEPLVEVFREEEWEFQFSWDRQATFMAAQSRAMVTLDRLIARYDAMANDEQKLKIEKMKQEMAIERERLEIEKKKSLGDSGAAETAHNERVTTLAQLINHPEPDRCIEDFEEEEEDKNGDD